MNSKFNSYDNFQIVNADFETYDFGHRNFDLVYSAATIQWIPEEIGFPKVYNLLKSNANKQINVPDLATRGRFYFYANLYFFSIMGY